MKNIIVLVFASIIIVGCGSGQIRYLTPQEAKEYPVVMIANCDIHYNSSKIAKGTIFVVKEIGGEKFKITHYDDVLKNSALMFDKKKELPEDALFIKLQENYNWGYIVYPNGQFVYENYFFFMYANGKLSTKPDQKCTYNDDPPFILKDNR